MASTKQSGSRRIPKKGMMNKKRTSAEESTGKKDVTSLVKKNEFTLILMGALLLTGVVFFIFFRPSDATDASKQVSAGAGASFIGLQKKVADLEQKISALEKKETLRGGGQFSADQLTQLSEQVQRLETALTLKVDSLIERMETNEKNIAILKQPVAVKKVEATPVKAAPPKAAQAKPATIPVKKPVKKKSILHTVQKKETLYSISKKYNTTVEKLRQMNKLSKNAKIYPGDNLVIR